MANGCGDKTEELEEAFQELLSSNILGSDVVAKQVGDQLDLEQNMHPSAEEVHMTACVLSSKYWLCLLVQTLNVLVTTIDAQWEVMGGCRVGEVRAGTTSPMPDHKGFKLQ